MKLIRCATMALFLFLPVLARAQAQPLVPCEPATQFNMAAPGTAASQASGVVLNGKDIGDWSAYWCPMPTGKWRLVNHAVITKYRNTLNWQAAFWSVVNAPDRLAALEDLAVRSRIVPAAGTVDEYEWKTLLYQACKAATYPPFLGAPINLPPDDFCGPVPVLPGPPVQVFKTPLTGTSLTIYRTSANKIVAIVSGKKAQPGATCNCSVVSIPGVTGPYCPLPDSLPGEVTQCVRAP